jgi:hypothetical protein
VFQACTGAFFSRYIPEIQQGVRLTLPQVHAISTIATEVEMNTFLKTLFGFLLLFSASAQAMNIMPSHSGSWYNPDQSGHGLSVEVVNSETLLIYWNTYHPDGTLAYQAASNGVVQEIGYGLLTMIDENTFEFEVTTPDGVRQGTGLFEDARVTLNLDELGVLSEPLDPAFDDAVSFDDIAGDYSGPDAIWSASVSPTGEFTGFSIGGEFEGTLTIPEPGFNQIV